MTPSRQAFAFHPDTGVYLGAVEAFADPLEWKAAKEAAFDQAIAQGSSEAEAAGVAEAVPPPCWLLPAFATFTEPPAFTFDEQAAFDGEAWRVEAAPEPKPAPDPIEPDPADLVRADRDGRIARVRWLIERHRDEQVLEIQTTLQAAVYLALLTYVQALRDVPQQAGFPDQVDWPSLPAVLEA